jgi:hypothetical protein
LNAHEYTQQLAYNVQDDNFNRPPEFYLSCINIARTRVTLDLHILIKKSEFDLEGDERYYTVGNGGDWDTSDFLAIKMMKTYEEDSDTKYDCPPLLHGVHDLDLQGNGTGGPSGLSYAWSPGGASPLRGTVCFQPIPADDYKVELWRVYQPLALTFAANQTCELGDEKAEIVIARARAQTYPYGSDGWGNSMMAYKALINEGAYDKAFTGGRD